MVSYFEYYTEVKKPSVLGLVKKYTIGLPVDKKEGYLTLSVSMPEPLVTAEMAQKAQSLLQRYIIAYKVEKSQVELQKVQTRMTIANSVYQQLASQLEQAKIQVKKDIPVFTIVEPDGADGEV